MNTNTLTNFICPECGSPYVRTFRGTGYNRCTACEYKWDIVSEPAEDNPYTEFAKEMSLLHEALKAEGFKDAMVDILAAMGPVVWNKLATKNLEKMITATIEAKIDENTMLFKEETK